MDDLDGIWEVERVGGALPPLAGVRKSIGGGRGETRLGPLPGVPFDVDGASLRYRWPFSFWVDVLDGEGDVRHGTATAVGLTLGRFRMTRINA